MRLYLDVETYRPRKEGAFVDEKVIAIGVVEDWTKYNPESASIKCEKNGPSGTGCVIRFFTSWENDNDEGALVRRFYEYFIEINNKNNLVITIGFNILRYDIPLLIQKGFEYRVESLDRLNVLWHNTFVVDYFQTTLPFNVMKFKGLNLEKMVMWAREAGLSLEELYGNGEDVVRWYIEGRYGDVIEHLRRDLEAIRTIDLNFRKFYSTLAKTLKP